MTDLAAPLLALDALEKRFSRRTGLRRREVLTHALDGVSLAVEQGSTFAVVGESGSGKSTLLHTALCLLPATAGRVIYDGAALTDANDAALRRLRREVSVVFQDPTASLNPRHSIGRSVAEPLEIHRIGDRRQRVSHLLELVGLAPNDADRRPGELSGGQRQRVAIARALATSPRLVALDEPVSSLDVSIRGQILNLLAEIQDASGLTYLLVSHDLGVVRQVADHVAVMYLGRIVEQAPATHLFQRPRHPYTEALLSAAPVAEPSQQRSRRRILLLGEPPNPAHRPTGCAFHPRCWKAEERCRHEAPMLTSGGEMHAVACHFPADSEIRSHSGSRA